jgi:hypothetical protein
VSLLGGGPGEVTLEIGFVHDADQLKAFVTKRAKSIFVVVYVLTNLAKNLSFCHKLQA